MAIGVPGSLPSGTVLTVMGQEHSDSAAASKEGSARKAPMTVMRDRVTPAVRRSVRVAAQLNPDMLFLLIGRTHTGSEGQQDLLHPDGCG
jgi:hypothetical protein